MIALLIFGWIAQIAVAYLAAEWVLKKSGSL